jgi:hypothetical protein
VKFKKKKSTLLLSLVACVERESQLHRVESRPRANTHYWVRATGDGRSGVFSGKKTSLVTKPGGAPDTPLQGQPTTYVAQERISALAPLKLSRTRNGRREAA